MLDLCVLALICFFNDPATTEIYTYDTLVPYPTLFRAALPPRRDQVLDAGAGRQACALTAAMRSIRPWRTCRAPAPARAPVRPHAGHRAPARHGGRRRFRPCVRSPLRGQARSGCEIGRAQV